MTRSSKTTFSQLPSLAPLSRDALNNPADVFLRLCSWTVPYGGEDRYYGKMLLHQGFVGDQRGNYSLFIPHPNGANPSTCFMAHLDTSSFDCAPISRIVKDNTCKTDGKTILGADDRAGVTILLYLAREKTPGLYYLFVGEEDGRIGSGEMAQSVGMPEHITKCVSFDRKGMGSVVTHQLGYRCCSDEFAEALCAELNQYGLEYSPDPSGVFTDSLEFAPTVSECTNISVGYSGQHSTKETQDLNFLSYLCKVCAGVDWEALPASRTPCDYGYDDGSRYDDGRSYVGEWDWRRDEETPISASEELFSSTRAGDAAFEAIDVLSSNFQCGLPVDRTELFKLLQLKAKDTVDMLEMLIDELQRAQWQG